MKDEKLAREFLASVGLTPDIFIQAAYTEIETPTIKILLSQIFTEGLKAGRREGWDAARAATKWANDPLEKTIGPYNLDNFSSFEFETFEDWEKEQDK